MLNYIDLFSGIGGFALAAWTAGMVFDNHFFSEIDKYCVELYKKRFPESIELGDIKKIDFKKLKKDYPGDWIITGGFPCQDISIAGKGAGIEGSRSGLWFEMWRAIRALRPEFAIIENVAAITFRGLNRVLNALAEIGYDAEWQDIRAEDVGAPHRRERIWIIAYPSSIRCNLRGFEREGIQRGNQARNEINSGGEEISDTEKTECKRSWNTRSGRNGFTDPYTNVSNSSIERLEREKSKGQRPGKQGLFTECNNELSDAGCEYKRGTEKSKRTSKNFTGCMRQWSTEPDVGRLANGVSHRVDRLKGLGNAIVPQIAMILFELIKPYIYGGEDAKNYNGQTNT